MRRFTASSSRSTLIDRHDASGSAQREKSAAARSNGEGLSKTVEPDHDMDRSVRPRVSDRQRRTQTPIHLGAQDLRPASDSECGLSRPKLRDGLSRLADDVLIFGTYGDAAELCRRWQAHADALALVAPFGVAADEIIATIDAVAAPGDLSSR
ncbi:MAG: hypothetical protein JWN96_2263 [Mycobacterium sp.]|jgi:hypothetical protein|nr:hypothetical protein [Mycobacterium sp.]